MPTSAHIWFHNLLSGDHPANGAVGATTAAPQSPSKSSTAPTDVSSIGSNTNIWDKASKAVSVQGPECAATHTGLGGALITYTVCSHESGQAVVTKVSRRPLEFDQLHKILQKQYTGYFLPHAPKKCKGPAEARILPSRCIVDERRLDLQAYLRAAARHPVLHSSEPLRLFLCHPGDMASCLRWNEMLQGPCPASADALLFGLEGVLDGGGAKGAGAAAGGRNWAGPGENSRTPRLHGCRPPLSPRLAAGFDTAAASKKGGVEGLSFTSLRGGSAGGLPPAVAGAAAGRGLAAALRQARGPFSAEEARLRDFKDTLRALQSQLAAACGSARSMVQRMEALSDDVLALGQGVATMSHFDALRQGRPAAAPATGGMSSMTGGPSAAAAAALRRQRQSDGTDEASVRSAELIEGWGERAAASLAWLHRWQVLVPEAILALEEREAALAAVELLREGLAGLQATGAAGAAPAAGGPGPKAAGAGAGAAVRAGDDTGTAADSGVCGGGDGAAAGVAKEPGGQGLVGAEELLQSRLSSAQLHYDLLLTRNLAEMERVRLEHADDFGDAVTQLARAQRNMAAAFVEAWGAGDAQRRTPDGMAAAAAVLR